MTMRARRNEPERERGQPGRAAVEREIQAEAVLSAGPGAAVRGPAEIVRLQRALGNRAVGRLLGGAAIQRMTWNTAPGDQKISNDSANIAKSGGALVTDINAIAGLAEGETLHIVSHLEAGTMGGQAPADLAAALAPHLQGKEGITIDLHGCFAAHPGAMNKPVTDPDQLWKSYAGVFQQTLSALLKWKIPVLASLGAEYTSDSGNTRVRSQVHDKESFDEYVNQKLKGVKGEEKQKQRAREATNKAIDDPDEGVFYGSNEGRFRFSDPDTDEGLEPARDAIESEAYPRRADLPGFVHATLGNLRESVELMEQSDGGQELVATLVRLISEGRLKVRVYTRGRLHAKAYIFDYGQSYDAAGRPLPQQANGVAIVGSSNFTLSGISHNTELNVVVHGDDNHAQLTAWFDELWAESQDFDAALMEELRQSWAVAQPTPYDIYMKTLYTLVQNRAPEIEQTSFLWNDDINDKLADFQRVAVRQAIQTIGIYGGCFVADVVGLGKSFIGAAIVKHFERVERARPLIICPKPLESMWVRYNEVYKLNAQVLPMSQLREGEDETKNILLDDVRFRDRDFVLIDESHNFRNPDSQRYRVLQRYLEGGRRCALLTATPRNRESWDVYHQIRLFHPGDITALPIDPPNLKSYFEGIEAGRKSLPELLSNILVRRTRSHIVRWYGYDAATDQRVDPENIAPYRSGERRAYVLVGGRKQTFPRRELRTVEYSIEATYQGLYDRLRAAMGRRHDDTAAADQPALRFARYNIWHYVIPAKEQQYRELRMAGINLRGLIRTMLFKRFESSVYAFCSTLKRMQKTHRAFLTALNNGLIPAGSEAIALLKNGDEWSETQLVDALSRVEQQYPAADFNLNALRADVAHDLEILGWMLEQVDPIGPEQDAKLQRIKHLLANRPGGDKVLIFSQYADTAQYLYDNLNPGRADKTIEVIYSNNRDKARIVARFSPGHNTEITLRPDDVPIQTLIATDVLSEGLNLQDCDTVINYDLHWNPVRLIQRFGRIDRIGSTNDIIYGINFLPERELERHLGLGEKLRARIRDIHETIGEDAAILEPGERLNERAMYAIYSGQNVEELDIEEDDGMIGLNEAEELLRQLRDDDPAEYERIANLRDGIRSGRWSDVPGRFVFCQAGRYQQLMLTDRDGAVITRDIAAILKLLRCEKTEQTVNPDPSHNRVVSSIQSAFAREVSQRNAEQQHAPRLSVAQRYVQRELQAFYATLQNDDLRNQISVLDTAFRQQLSRSVAAEINAIKRAGLQGAQLIQELTAIYTRYGLDQNRRNALTAEDVPPKIICSAVLA